ncbi:MAG: efflux RND transporter periplasmic adaptor subunit [Bacillota bacterium]|nr:efflux RND transporter periplasmic adaptor subunit [Bacillota bacterium]MDD3298185.1 efflux RND transporter periplasmic adaptor subunit [Bacillota bacterium]MDD4707045.1 efflux RND transporter periplasmic adaptor subunit [Bacillota bacterium]
MRVRAFGKIKEMVKRKKKVVWIAVLAVVLIFYLLFQSMGSAVEVTTALAVRGDISNIVEQTGDIETAKKQDIYAVYGGRIKGIPAEVGQTVKEGQLLLEFDLDELNIRLDQAEAGLALVEGSAVTGAEVAAALAAYEGAAVQRDRAKEAFESAVDLFEMGAMSDVDFRQTREVYDLSELQLNATVAALEAAKKGETSQQASMAAAQAEVSLIKRQIEEARPLSNMEGVVLEIGFEEGMTVPPGSLVMRIGNPDSLQVRCRFLAGEAVDIKEGDDALISGDILNGEVLKGRVNKVFPQAVTEMSQLGVEQQRVPVEIELLESHRNLRPGFGVDVEVITDKAENVFMVPRDAVFEMEEEDCVFVVEGGKAVLRKVSVGIENKDWAQIVEGLNEGDTVIVDPPNKIEEGVRVKEA